MNLMRFLRRPISLRQRLILTIGAILLVFELISVFWLWHESTEQIQLFEQALRDNRNNDRHIMREIREAVASLIVPGVFMVSLTLFICYQAVRRITARWRSCKRAGSAHRRQLNAHCHSQRHPRNRSGGFSVKRSGQSPDQHAG